MEEAREFTAVIGVFDDWSARHTRLRYQCVLTTLIFAMTIHYGVETVKIPGVVTFSNTPTEQVTILVLFSFALFSLVSFVFQHLLEESRKPNEFKQILRYVDDLNIDFQSKKGRYYKIEENYESFLTAILSSEQIAGDISYVGKKESEVLEDIKNLKKELDTELESRTDLNDDIHEIIRGSFSLWRNFLGEKKYLDEALRSLIPKQHYPKNEGGVGLKPDVIDTLMKNFREFQLRIELARRQLLAVRKYINLRSTLVAAQFKLLSFILPITVSLLLLGYGIIGWIHV